MLGALEELFYHHEHVRMNEDCVVVSQFCLNYRDCQRLCVWCDHHCGLWLTSIILRRRNRIRFTLLLQYVYIYAWLWLMVCDAIWKLLQFHTILLAVEEPQERNFLLYFFSLLFFFVSEEMGHQLRPTECMHFNIWSRWLQFVEWSFFCVWLATLEFYNRLKLSTQRQTTVDYAFLLLRTSYIECFIFSQA